MNAELLLVHFNRISDAPDAVPRLRRFILDLAVRGKLVAQDANDEPASELLRQIRLEKMRSTREGGHKREGPSVPVELDEHPFSLPWNWEWVKLIDLLTKLTDGTHHSPTNLAQGDFKYITAKNIKPEGISLEELTYISEDVHQAIYSRCNPELGDILYIKDGATTGVVTINNLDEPFSMLSSVALLKLSNGAYNRLIVEFLRSPFFYSQMRGFMKGAAITRVTLKRMAPALIPLPPRAEQYRIVAKVDELMALCDQLEAAQRERGSRRDRLTAATHHHLNNGADVDALRVHAQFFIGHLPRLTTRPDQIRQFRQTILNLAVRGKLVSQRLSDEPASKLLKRIQEEKARLIKAGEIEKQRPLPAIQDSALPFRPPNGWTWTRLGDLTQLVTSGSRDWAKYYSTRGAIFLRMGNLSRDSYRLRLASIQRVLPPTGGEGSRTKLEEGDVLISITGEVGLLGLIPPNFGEAYINQHTCLVRPMGELVGCFLPQLFCSPFGQQQFDEPQRGLKNSFRLTDVTHFLVPLPPLAEQHRIVAKVDELMALCGQLEARLTTAENEVSRLLESVLHDALNSPVERLESALST